MRDTEVRTSFLCINYVVNHIVSSQLWCLIFDVLFFFVSLTAICQQCLRTNSIIRQSQSYPLWSTWFPTVQRYYNTAELTRLRYRISKVSIQNWQSCDTELPMLRYSIARLRYRIGKAMIRCWPGYIQYCKVAIQNWQSCDVVLARLPYRIGKITIQYWKVAIQFWKGYHTFLARLHVRNRAIEGSLSSSVLGVLSLLLGRRVWDAFDSEHAIIIMKLSVFGIQFYQDL